MEDSRKPELELGSAALQERPPVVAENAVPQDPVSSETSIRPEQLQAMEAADEQASTQQAADIEKALDQVAGDQSVSQSDVLPEDVISSENQLLEDSDQGKGNEEPQKVTVNIDGEEVELTAKGSALVSAEYDQSRMDQYQQERRQVPNGENEAGEPIHRTEIVLRDEHGRIVAVLKGVSGGAAAPPGSGGGSHSQNKIDVFKSAGVGAGMGAGAFAFAGAVAFGFPGIAGGLVAGAVIGGGLGVAKHGLEQWYEKAFTDKGKINIEFPPSRSAADRLANAAVRGVIKVDDLKTQLADLIKTGTVTPDAAKEMLDKIDNYQTYKVFNPGPWRKFIGILDRIGSAFSGAGSKIGF